MRPYKQSTIGGLPCAAPGNTETVVPHLTPHAITVLEKRYLKKDEKGRVIVTPEEMFWRVATNIAEAEHLYGNRNSAQERAEDFFRMMVSFGFLPNSPCLMNAGKELQQLAACFVLPVEDSLDSIFETVKQTLPLILGTMLTEFMQEKAQDPGHRKENYGKRSTSHPSESAQLWRSPGQSG